jgi:hypothetical protein
MEFLRVVAARISIRGACAVRTKTSETWMRRSDVAGALLALAFENTLGGEDLSADA